MELRQLRYFLAVAETLSFTRAAVALGVRQPTVSRHVRALEDTLGVSFFERVRDGVRLTAAGYTFLRDARRIVFEARRAADNAARAGRAEVGCLTLGFFTSLASGRLHDILAAHRRAWPEVAFTFVEGPPTDLLSGLRDRRLDLAVLAGAIDAPELALLPLWTDRIYAALPKDHALATRSAVRWETLAELPLLLRTWESGAAAYDFLIGRLAPGRRLPLASQHLAGRESLVGLVAAGFGVTLVAEPATAVSYPGVVFRSIAEADAVLPISVAWRRENDNPALQRFISFVRDQPQRAPPAARS